VKGVRDLVLISSIVVSIATWSTPVFAQDAITTLVGRLDLERYKATIKGLTQFGDRRQGTDRNRAAVDWIEAQLKTYGCTNTERLKYDYDPSAPPRPAGTTASPVRARGFQMPTGVNTDPLKQPDVGLRELDSQPRHRALAKRCTARRSEPPPGRDVSHLRPHGRTRLGRSRQRRRIGTALVMEVARVLSSPDVQTERSVRFILWNNEETGLNGSRAYVEQRSALQGQENPAGSGKYPEPNGSVWSSTT
jgi:hypothetical protein